MQLPDSVQASSNVAIFQVGWFFLRSLCRESRFLLSGVMRRTSLKDMTKLIVFDMQVIGKVPFEVDFVYISDAGSNTTETQARVEQLSGNSQKILKFCAFVIIFGACTTFLPHRGLSTIQSGCTLFYFSQSDLVFEFITKA